MRSSECRPEYLQPSAFIDSDAPSVRAFTERALAGMADATPTQKAIRLFDAVRDQLRYDPFNVPTIAEEYRASHVALQSTAYCVPKAILLTAAYRAAGIPAAVGFADVRNHLNSPKLAELMDTDLFIYHGYVSLWLDGRMIKVTPAFNSELCERFGVKPLIFDGRNDALFHEFDIRNNRHMEYVNDRGWFADPPMDKLLTEFRTTYPKLWTSATARAAIRDEAFVPGR
jgi:transglutaminase-like putative cysteine protease